MNNKITVPICDKSAAADFTTELSMPDYQPEVRRLLRVGVTLTPAEPFFDGSRVGANGEIIYDILYSAGDGGLYSVRTAEPYELSEALKGFDRAGELVLLCDAVPESLTSRVTAPRKLSMKCRVRCRMRGFAESELDENMGYIADTSSIMRLKGDADYTRILPSAVCRMEVSDELGVDGGALRVVSHNASVEIEGVDSGADEAAVRGAVCLSLLLTDEDDGSFSRVERRIPFAESLDVEGLSPDSVCRAAGVCTGAEFDVGEGSVACNLELCLRLDASEPCRAEYTRDVYSTELHSESSLRAYEFTAQEKNFSGNLTVSLYEPLEALGIDSDFEIIDTAASAAVKNTEQEGRKMAVSGEAVFNLLGKRGDEYLTKELKLPFRYETEGTEGALAFADASALALSARAKSDGARLSADSEIMVWGRICPLGRFEAVDSCAFGEPVERDGDITVCFKSSSDTVWELSKRYHIPSEQLVAKNPDANSQAEGFVII